MDTPHPVPASAPVARQRLLSLDVFRGVTVVAMILVNNPGSARDAYPALRHAEWHGVTPTDLVFPFFLFIVGASIHYAFEKPLSLGATRAWLYGHILRRTFMLFALGVLVANLPFYDPATLRLTGVLQRIAFCYCGAALIRIHFVGEKKELSVRSILWLSLALLAGYYFVMRWVPAPNGAWDSITNNLAARVDKALLGAAHLRKGKDVYDSMGLLPTIPALVTTLSGMLCAWWLSRPRDRHERLALLLLAGCGCCLAGYMSSALFPLSKNLWSSSYVLFTTGLACLFMGACHWQVDIKGRTRGTRFFLIYGSNAITAYCASEMAARMLSITGAGDAAFRAMGGLFSPAFTSLVYAAGFVLIWWIPLGLLYRRKIYIKV